MVALRVLLFVLSFSFLEGCGVPTVDGSRVIGGKDALYGAWPWQILLINRGRAGCGGSIISPNWILTAAHCVRSRSASTYKARVGDYHLKNKDFFEEDYDVIKIIVHPEFIRKRHGDVALIKLAKPIKFNKYVQPVCLPSAPVAIEKLCYVTGWGRSDRGKYGLTSKLQQATMPIITQQKCADAMIKVAPHPISKLTLCAGLGHGKISGCHGDSGGPFVCNNGRQWELHGIVSWGSKRCNEKVNQYSVFSNVYNLKGWIETEMKNN